MAWPGGRVQQKKGQYTVQDPSHIDKDLHPVLLFRIRENRGKGSGRRPCRGGGKEYSETRLAAQLHKRTDLEDDLADPIPHGETQGGDDVMIPVSPASGPKEPPAKRGSSTAVKMAGSR